MEAVNNGKPSRFGLFVKSLFARDREKEAKRVWEIDFVRGVIILCMAIDHFIGSLWFLFPHIFYYHSGNVVWFENAQAWSITYWMSEARVTVRCFGLALLVILTGISSKFSRHNLFRSLALIVLGSLFLLTVNIISCFTSLKEYLIFPTLTCIGVCIFAYWGVKSLHDLIVKKIYKRKHQDISTEELDKIPAKSWKWVALAFFVVLMTINCVMHFSVYKEDSGYLVANWFTILSGFNAPWISPIEKGIFVKLSFAEFLSLIIGKTQYGADYLSLFPAISYIFLGGFIGETLYKDRKSFIKYFIKDEEKYFKTNRLINKIFMPITFSGKHSLVVYVVHMPIIVLVVGIILLCKGCRLSI